MSEYTKIMGKNIRLKRKQKGMTIDDFAKEVKLVPGFLGLVERGQRSTSIKNLVAIADYLGVTLEEILRYDLSTNKPIDPKILSRSQKKLLEYIEEMSDVEVSLMTRIAKALIDYDISE